MKAAKKKKRKKNRKKTTILPQYDMPSKSLVRFVCMLVCLCLSEFSISKVCVAYDVFSTNQMSTTSVILMHFHVSPCHFLGWFLFVLDA